MPLCERRCIDLIAAVAGPRAPGEREPADDAEGHDGDAPLQGAEHHRRQPEGHREGDATALPSGGFW